MTPALLLITKVTCNATDDYTGSDDLVGLLGSYRFKIGSFRAGVTIEPMLEQPIPAGVTEFVVLESDLTGDDELLRVDLGESTDIDRIVGVMGTDARYDICFRVTSQS